MTDIEYRKLLKLLKTLNRHLKREDVYRASKAQESIKLEIKKIYFKKNEN